MAVTQELLDTETGQILRVMVDFDARTLSVNGSLSTHGSDEELNGAYLHAIAALKRGRSLRNLEGGEARALDLARMRRPGSQTHKLTAALAKLRRDDGVDYVINLTRGNGVSKIGGEPDLPPSLAWPGDRLFVAQIAFKELKALDVCDALPKLGFMYLFISKDTRDSVAIYSATEDVRPRKCEVQDDERFYTRDLSERRLGFAPAYAGIAQDHVATEVREKLERAVGFALEADNASRIFGSPTAEPGVDVFDDREDSNALRAYDGQYTLALQLRFAGGFLYVGVPADDLLVGDFSRSRATYWGT